MNGFVNALVITLISGSTTAAPVPTTPPATQESNLIIFEQTEEERLWEEEQKRIEEQKQIEKANRLEEQKRLEEEKLQPSANETKNAAFDFDIASYTTNYSTSKSNANRNYNMELASEAVNGIILNPGDTFSFDKALNTIPADKPFLPAPIISGEKMVNAPGGGICQISTTLYNAALYSGMTITERRNHSLMVGYVPAGRDATYSSGTIDFCFKNELDTPVMIESTIGGGTLKIRFLSTEDPKLSQVQLKSEFDNGVYYLYRHVDGKIDYTAKSTYKK